MNVNRLGYMLVGLSVILLLVMAFVKSDIDTQSTLLCQQFQMNGQDMSECPVHKSNISWMVVSAFGLSFLLMGTGAYMVFMPQPEMKREFRQIDVSKLGEDEKRIYGIVKSKNGSVYQTDLVRETGFGKVKVTRILDGLETKAVLERKRRGMANLVVLK